jgi:methyl-accepting chemotaxis protein
MGLGFGLVLAIMTAGALVMTFSIRTIKEHAAQVRSESLPFADEAARMQFQAVNMQQFLTDIAATGREEGFGEAEKAARDFRQRAAKFEAKARRENDGKLLAEIQAITMNFEALYEVGVRMAKVYSKDGREAGNNIMKDFDARSDALAERLTPLKESQLKEADDAVAAVVASLASNLSLQYILLAVSLAIGVTAAWMVSRGILRQLGAEPEVVAALARDVAEGRFDAVRDAIAGRGQIRGVLSDMAAMAEKLRTSFGEIAQQKAAAEAGIEEAQRSRQAAEEAVRRAERARLEGMAEAGEELDRLSQSAATLAGLIDGLRREADAA